MCGRYYIVDETDAYVRRLIERTIPKAGKTASKAGQPVSKPAKAAPEVRRTAGDIHPSDTAPVITGGKKDRVLLEAQMRWGFVPPRSKSLLINARAETALQKPSFSESILYRRCLIPAAGFYEWNRSKSQFSFFLPEKPVLFMAGCYRQHEDGDHFTILTTEANESMADVHDRMPLIIPEADILDWLFEGRKTTSFLKARSPLLRKTLTNPTEDDLYEQMTLPFS